MKRVTDLSAQKLMSKILKWGTQIVFLAALIIMAYLSFVDNFEIRPDVRNITTIAVVALVLNWIIWDSRYRSEYDKAMTSDIMSKEYSIHRRYYFARKGLKQAEVQQYIRQYNQDFVKAWKEDVEDITGRKFEDIEKEGYKGHDHKLLIWKIKHHKYPMSGIKRAREVLSVLAVSGSDGMKIHIKKAEHQHMFGRIQKIVTSTLSTVLAASITVNFIHGNWESAILTLLLNVVILFMSLFFGAMSGVKGAKLKLSTAEQISELLEEWRKQPPKEEPYQESVIALNGGVSVVGEQQVVNQDTTVIESSTSSVIELT